MEKKLSQIAMEFVASDNGEGLEPTVLAVSEPSSAHSMITSPEHIESREQSKKASKRGRPSLKEMDQGPDQVQIPPDEVLFQKQYYSIGEVAKWFQVNQSLVRYWETEFEILQPRKNRKGDRYFRPVDVKNLQLIYDLLRRRKFTIEGAKDYLKNAKRAEEKFAMIQSLERIKSFLLELKASL